MIFITGFGVVADYLQRLVYLVLLMFYLEMKITKPVRHTIKTEINRPVVFPVALASIILIVIAVNPVQMAYMYNTD